MSIPKLTPLLREKIEALMQADRVMHGALNSGVSEAADEAVAGFDMAVGDVIIAARAAGFGVKKSERDARKGNAT